MSDAALMIALALAATLAVVVAVVAGLRGWQGWLEVRRLEIEHGRGGSVASGRSVRPDLSELRARVRRLESIANGSDI